MALDRVAVLRQTERLVREGKLDQAIAECTKVVDEQPRDWATVNLLGDLLVRTGRIDEAVDQYVRCGETLRLLGFLPKAAALYRKILNLRPDTDVALVQAGEVAAAQGLMVDARRFLTAAADLRRRRGDLAAAEQMRARLDRLVAGANGPGRRAGGAGALFGGAGSESGGGADRDPALLFALAEMRLRTGDPDAGLGVLEELVQRHEPSVTAAADLAARLATELHDDTGFQLAERVVAVSTARGDWAAGARTMRRFLTACPAHVRGLQRLVELCAKGGLAEEGAEAQMRLFDAYLAEGRVDEARALARAAIREHPELADQTDRLRSALAAAGVDLEPETAAPPPPPAPPPEIKPAPDPGVARASSPHAIDLESVLGALEHPEGQAEPAADEEIDLSDLLDELPSVSGTREAAGGEVGTPGMDLEGVFQQLREEAEGDTGAGAGEVAFQRGKALYDAGAFDDCVAPLTSGARLPARRFEAASLLAQLFRSRKQIVDAVRWLDVAADTPGLDPVERRRILLELADLLEQNGEAAGALAVCLELQAEAGDYRDVQARIARLAPRQAGG